MEGEDDYSLPVVYSVGVISEDKPSEDEPLEDESSEDESSEGESPENEAELIRRRMQLENDLEGDFDDNSLSYINCSDSSNYDSSDSDSSDVKSVLSSHSCIICRLKSVTAGPKSNITVGRILLRDPFIMENIRTEHVILRDRKIEWQIDDFLQLENDLWYFSPDFDFPYISGFVCICLPSQKQNGPFECADLSFVLASMPEDGANVTVAVSLKTVNGRSYSEKTLVVTEPWIKFSIAEFVSISELKKRRSELLPSGTLTIICTFKSNDSNADSGVWELQQHLHEISRNGDMSDITLKVDDQIFEVHRCILAARSPVFSAMLKNEMKDIATGVFTIQDVDPPTFSEFLDHLYTGSTRSLTSENAAKLYTTADKYEVNVLKESCLNHMLMNISVENFCDMFVLSVQYNEERLKETCLQYFGKHMLDIIMTRRWQTLMFEDPMLCNELHIKHLQLIKNN